MYFVIRQRDHERSVEHAALVGGNHVLDVDKSVLNNKVKYLSSCLLQQFQSFTDEVSHI